MNTTQSARAVAITAIALGGVIAIGTVTSAAASTLASSAQQTTSRQVAVSGVDQIDVDVNAGSLRVEFADVDTAELTVTGGAGAERWTLRQDGTELRVATPNHSFWWLSWPRWFGRGDSGDGVLRLPQALAGSDADLELAAGSLVADGDFADLDISSGAGRVQVDGSAETVSADISAGRADLNLADVSSADLELSAGEMDATLTGAQPQTLKLRASAGSMNVTVPEGDYDVSEDTSAGRFENRIGSTPGAASTVSVDLSAGRIVLSTDR